MGAVKYYEAVLLDIEQPLEDTNAVVRHRISRQSTSIQAAPLARSCAAKRPDDPYGLALPNDTKASVWRTLFSLAMFGLVTWMVIP